MARGGPAVAVTRRLGRGAGEGSGKNDHEGGGIFLVRILLVFGAGVLPPEPAYEAPDIRRPGHRRDRYRMSRPTAPAAHASRPPGGVRRGLQEPLVSTS